MRRPVSRVLVVLALVTGPLLYHFAETEGEDSIELSYEELREVIVQFDLEIIVSAPTCYYDDRISMCFYCINANS